MEDAMTLLLVFAALLVPLVFAWGIVSLMGGSLASNLKRKLKK
jgi:hypothetical protein